MNEPRFYPNIDYRTHPAFRNLDVLPRDDDAAVDAMIEAIDRELDRVHRTAYDAPGLQSAFDQGPARKISELAIYLHRTISSARVKHLLDRSFDDVIKELREEARIRNDRHHFYRVLSREAQVVATDLRNNGAHICRLPDSERKKIVKLSAPVIGRLRAAAANDSTSRITESIPRYSGIGVRLNNFFRKEGILEGLSAYYGSNVTFIGFALECSFPAQVWWRNLYADVGFGDTKTAYMHYDHGCRNPKAIIALSDVTEENGPTGFIKGSHKKPRSNFVHFLIKSIDACFDRDNPVQGTGFYRYRFREPRFRREFLMLPTALQACSHFGEDIPDDDPVADELLKNEIRLTREVGNCVVFDGDYGIHRGALVTSGERLVFQVIFAVEPDMPKSAALRQRARAVARRLVKGN